jgi:hypothetical protein
MKMWLVILAVSSSLGFIAAAAGRNTAQGEPQVTVIGCSGGLRAATDGEVKLGPDGTLNWKDRQGSYASYTPEAGELCRWYRVDLVEPTTGEAI